MSCRPHVHSRAVYQHALQEVRYDPAQYGYLYMGSVNNYQSCYANTDGCRGPLVANGADPTRYQQMAKGFVDDVFSANDSHGYNGHRRGTAADDVVFEYKVGTRVIFTHMCDTEVVQRCGSEYQCVPGAGLSKVRVQKGMRGTVTDVLIQLDGSALPIVEMQGDALSGKLVVVRQVTVTEMYTDPRTNKRHELRVQLAPMMYGWACTGYSMGLHSMWGEGMAYVAFSRAVGWEFVRIQGMQDMWGPQEFNEKVFKCSPRVAALYASMRGPTVGPVRSGETIVVE
jgi:hypothetical protein